MALSRRAVLATIGTVSLAGCLDDVANGGDTDPPSHTHDVTVRIEDGEFLPGEVDAGAGHELTVTFENRDEEPYSLRTDDGELSASVDASDTVKCDWTIPERPDEYVLRTDNGNTAFVVEAVPEDLLSGCSDDE